jgi:alkanesulfonate monooxygenase SsuD/methylene tetrahydromethanopterin reductase-like flavin-dependent oxidoreductase (luciferase family)
VLSEPYAMVCASVIVADTDEHARYIAGPGALSFVRLRQGRPAPLATPQEAADHPYTEIDQLVIEDRMASQIIGSPSTVRAGLDELMESTAADELMVTTIVHGHDDRLRSFELLSEVAERSPSMGRSAAHT